MLAQTPAPNKSGVTPGAPKAPAKSAAPSGLMNPGSLKARAPDVYRVKFTTTKGDFVIEVNRAWAPIGADRFYNLVRNGFFTDASFFRVIPGFVAQFGIPANSRIAAAWQNANILDDRVMQSNKKGTITFATTAEPNTRTTQLFLNLADNTPLDSQGFAPFGTVTEGMDVVLNLYGGYGDRPQQDLIQSQGKAYLDKNFPQLDSIKSATVIFPEPNAPAATKSAPSSSAAPSKK